MNSHRIGGYEDSGLFALRHRLIYGVEDSILVCSSLLYVPDFYLIYNGAGRYIAPHCVHVQILQTFCEIPADSGCPCFNGFFVVAP